MPITSIDIDLTRMHDLTIEEIKACSSFAHFSDEELQVVLNTFKALSIIAFECIKNDKKTNKFT